jgi:hypothetical protein
MRYEDLSPADQQLLSTDLGEVEKVASEKVAMADEAYAHGFFKLAQQTADYLEEIYAAQSEKVAEDSAMDSESEKIAAELGAFTERGFFDGLRKLGSDRYGDETVYLMPLVEEKVAGDYAKKGLELFNKVRGGVTSAAKAVKEAPGKWHGGASAQIEKGKKIVEKAESKIKQHSGKAKGPLGQSTLKEQGKRVWKGRLEQAKGYGKHVAPYAGAATGLAGLGAYALKGKKKPEGEGQE